MREINKRLYGVETYMALYCAGPMTCGRLMMRKQPVVASSWRPP
jgi:hypothetical protein